MMNRERWRATKRPGIACLASRARLTDLRSAGYDCGARRHSLGVRFVLAVVLVSLFVAGCSKGNAWDDPGAKESFETFLMDLWRGNRAEAFAAVWPDDQKRLMAAGDVLAKEYPKVSPLKPEEWLVVSRVDNPYDIRRLEMVSKASTSFERGDRVTLEIHYYDDRVGKTEMVWGGERWYVALPEGVASSEMKVEPADQPAVDVVDSDPEVDDEALLLQDEEVSTVDE